MDVEGIRICRDKGFHVEFICMHMISSKHIADLVAVWHCGKDGVYW